MPSLRRFSAPLLGILRDGKTVRIKAGARHRFVGIWGVVVEGRLFVRSWSIKAHSWYRTFLKDPRGFIQLSNRTIPVRAVRTRSGTIAELNESRSEEHTSNSSHQIISYAVFCLKKKK